MNESVLTTNHLKVIIRLLKKETTHWGSPQYSMLGKGRELTKQNATREKIVSSETMVPQPHNPGHDGTDVECEGKKFSRIAITVPPHLKDGDKGVHNWPSDFVQRF